VVHRFPDLEKKKLPIVVEDYLQLFRRRKRRIYTEEGDRRGEGGGG